MGSGQRFDRTKVRLKKKVEPLSGRTFVRGIDRVRFKETKSFGRVFQFYIDSFKPKLNLYVRFLLLTSLLHKVNIGNYSMNKQLARGLFFRLEKLLTELSWNRTSSSIA